MSLTHMAFEHHTSRGIATFRDSPTQTLGQSRVSLGRRDADFFAVLSALE